MILDEHASIFAFYMINAVVATELVVKNCPVNCKCDLLIVNCSSAGISDTSFEYIYYKVEFLDLSKNDLRTIPEALGAFVDIIALNLSWNKISTISRYTFARMWKLKTLDLSANKIKSLVEIEASSLFAGNAKLQTLNLSQNPLSEMGDGYDDILYSDSLQLLDVSGCRFESVQGPIVLHGLRKLKHLVLSRNPVTRLEGLASDSLLSLDISHCNLQFLRDNFASLTKLKELRIASNNYLNDQHFKPSSKTITYLDVSYCSLDTNYASELAEVKTVTLKGNRIKTVGKHAFRNNTKLEYLDLSENLIRHVDEFAFYGAEYLRHVDLSSNSIAELGENTFAFTPYLLSVNVSRNSFKTLGKFEGSSLMVLDVSNCKLESLTPDAFARLPLLRTFNASYNFLENLPENLTSNSLQLLDASYCRITAVNSLNFHTLIALQEINLTGNRLVHVRNNTFAANDKLNRILIGDNPWKCDCSDENFRSLWTYLTGGVKPLANESTLACLYPENVTGKSWRRACAADWNDDNSAANSSNSTVLIVILIIFVISGIVALFAILVMDKPLWNDDEDDEESEQRDRSTNENVNVQLITSENENTVRESIRKFTRLPSYDEALLLPRPPSSSSFEIGASSTTLHEKSCEKVKRRQSSTQTDDTMNVLLQEVASPDKEKYSTRVIRRPSLEEIEYINIQLPPQCTEL